MKSLPLALPVLLLVLAGCSASTSANSATIAATAVQPTPTATALEAADLSRTDEQGAVTVMITPETFDKPGNTLDFDVALDTHSVDLTMDLAALATLSTDTGLAVRALKWDAPSGGHHVSGRLSFPVSVDGTPLLQKGATKLTLTLRDVAAPERIFTWELSQ